jgi:hypothetical protein
VEVHGGGGVLKRPVVARYWEVTAEAAMATIAHYGTHTREEGGE